VVAASSLFGAACAFDLADVISADAGSETSDAPSPGDGGAQEAGDGGSSDAEAGSDAGPPFVLLATPCPGQKVTAISLAGGNVYVTCGSGGWSLDGGLGGALASGPLDGGGFVQFDGGLAPDDAGADAEAGAPVVASPFAEALASTDTNLVLHGACGIYDLADPSSEALVSTISPLTVSAAALTSARYVFAGLRADGLYAVDSTNRAGAVACTAAPGSTTFLGPTAGPSEGIAIDGTTVYDYVCSDPSQTLGLYEYSTTTPLGSIPVPRFQMASGGCGSVPLGIAFFQGRPYFPVGATIKSCKLVGAQPCMDYATEVSNVTLLTTDGTNLYWMAGSVLRRDGPATVIDTGRTVTALYAGQGVLLWGTSSGEVYKR
jgi:hypothetical protein